MNNKYIQKSCIKKALRALRKRGIPLLLVGAFVWTLVGEAQAASGWNPTLLVNTESFNVIDDGDGTTDIEVRFGETVDERLRWMINENRFEFSRDLRVAGTITATGSISSSGSLTASGNLTINSDNGAIDATITFGNDGGAETLKFTDSTNEFDLSDDLNITGTADVSSNLSASGVLSVEGASSLQGAITAGSTIDAVGSITTDANLTINEDNGDADAVLTFGNDAGAKALTYSNANTRFEFADDVHVTGTLETTSDVTVGGTITLNGVTYTFPPSDGVSSGWVLKTDSAGTLSWAADTDTDTGILEADADNRYVNVSGDTMTGNLIIGNGKTLSVSGTIVTETNLTINEDNGAVDAILTFGNDSGAETFKFDDSSNEFQVSDDLHVDDNLSASGTLSVEGASALQGNTTVTGTLDTTGNITTDANLTINEDNGGANAVLTFGNDSGAETIQFNDSTNEFDISDDVNITGTMDVSSNLSASGVISAEGDISTDGNLSGSTLTVDGGVTLRNIAYTPPSADGTNGQALTTDGAGNLSWSASGGGTGSGGVIFLSPEYPHSVYFNSGSLTNKIGQLSYDYDETNNENYYRWDTTKSTMQEYWISTRVRVPDNFSAWDDVRPIQLRYRTGSGLTTANYISMRLYDTAGSEVTLTSGNQLANTSWTTATITGPDSAGTYTTGSYITVALKLSGTNPADTGDNGWVDAGYINLNWETTAP